MKKSLYALSFVAIVMLGCDGDEISKSSGKLDYYTESYDLAGLGLDFTPQYKVTYQYDHDKLIRYSFFGYNPESKSFEKQRYFDFSYVEGRVDKLRGFLPGATSHYVEYSYQYTPDGRVLKISEDNDGTGINSEANFSYNDEEETVNVAYTFSNGGSFEYEFNYVNQNILNDKTTRGAQLCSDGVYTYDDHKNPLSELGYVDYTLTNISSITNSQKISIMLVADSQLWFLCPTVMNTIISVIQRRL